jgi:hypothetical protein
MDNCAKGKMRWSGTNSCYPALALLALTANNTSAAEFGSIDQAKNILERAVTEVKANAELAIAKFNHNEAPFRDRDLFVFCFNADNGKFTAHEALIGTDVRELRDALGRPFGIEMYNAPAVDGITEIAFIWPLPGTSLKVAKRAYMARIGEQICGVSAYLQTTAATSSQ